MNRHLVSASAAIAAFFVLVIGGSAADSFTLTVVSQTTSTITFSYPQQAGYGYLYSANGVVVSRTNDPTKTSVKFSKANSYEVAAIVKGATGSYPVAPPPPPPAACANGVDDDGDGKVDLADPGCSSSSDTDETDPAPPPVAQCADGLDNDGDGKVDLADPGCSSSTDNDETDVVQPPPTGFPDASNTGVPAGTTLTAYTGPSNITAANTVITGKTIGCITISTTGVVIRNSRISGQCGYAVVNIDDRTSPNMMVTIEDSEISCNGQAGGAGIGESDFTLRRVEVTQCENGADMNQNILIEDSYIHNLYNGGESHADGVQVALGHWNGSSFVCCGKDITLRHNTIFGMGDNDTSFGTSAIITTSNDENVLIDSNLLAGGAYTLYCNRPGKGTNFRVVNNKFSTRFKSTVGFYGPWTDCADEDQSGNVYYETGLPLG